jgi:hypothetical protein
MQWFINGIEIIPGKYEVAQHDVGVKASPLLPRASSNRSIEIYDILGRKVDAARFLMNQSNPSRSGFSSGLYIYRGFDLKTGNAIQTGKRVNTK